MEFIQCSHPKRCKNVSCVGSKIQKEKLIRFIYLTKHSSTEVSPVSLIQTGSECTVWRSGICSDLYIGQSDVNVLGLKKATELEFSVQYCSWKLFLILSKSRDNQVFGLPFCFCSFLLELFDNSLIKNCNMYIKSRVKCTISI